MKQFVTPVDAVGVLRFAFLLLLSISLPREAREQNDTPVEEKKNSALLSSFVCCTLYKVDLRAGQQEGPPEF